MAFNEEVFQYSDLLDPKRKNQLVPGFSFDVDTFENLVDCFTPKDSIPILLRVQTADLDRFCRKVYGLSYNETYKTLTAISTAYCLKVYKNLSLSGNSTAMNIVKTHLLHLDDDNNKNNITVNIINDINHIKEDDQDDR